MSQLQGLVLFGEFLGSGPATYFDRDTGAEKQLNRTQELRVRCEGSTGKAGTVSVRFFDVDQFGEGSEVSATMDSEPPKSGEQIAVAVRPNRFGDLVGVRFVEVPAATSVVRSA